MILIETFMYEFLQASFFMTYVLTSGWASLAVEMVQPLGLVYNTMKKCVCRIKEDQPNGFLSFPYHTEVSKLLMFGFLGFICSVMAPLILPLLLIYFVLAYLVYKNQVLISSQYFHPLQFLYAFLRIL